MGLALTVTTALLALGSFALILTIQSRSSNAAHEALRRVWADGTPATATVVSATKNGSVKHHPRVLLHLELTEPGRPARKAQVTQVISQVVVGELEPGDEIAVKVDPEDPANIVVDPELTPYTY
jgi:hypothetical protein